MEKIMNIHLIKNLIHYAFKKSKIVPIKYYKNLHTDYFHDHPNIIVKYGNRILFSKQYDSMKELHEAEEYADILQNRLPQCEVVLEMYIEKL